MQKIEELLRFIESAPTSFHAIREGIRRLEGFTLLEECRKWKLEPGGRYVVTRNGSSLIAFVIPENAPVSFQMVASHSDSPMFKIKEHAETEVQGRYARLDTEAYGGMIMASWMDRPLSVAGRVVVRDDGRLVSRLVDMKDVTAVIPHVAIHMNRNVNDGFKYEMHKDMVPLWGDGHARGKFLEKVAEQAGCAEDDILGHDLFLYNCMPGVLWGMEQEFFSSPRIDNLECAFASLEAIREARNKDQVLVCAIFDNEEVGSTTRQGANASFLSDVLSRIAGGLGIDAGDLPAMLSRSFMVSADNAHATHPNHPEYADPENQVFMNEGVVIKHSANQKYTTDAVSQALFVDVCREAGVPVQHFANRSDMRGGSTLGNLSASHISVPTLDIGLAQLSMHSSFETAGSRDLDAMILAMQTFYTRRYRTLADGEMQILGS